jgi:hypothetical protein
VRHVTSPSQGLSSNKREEPGNEVDRDIGDTNKALELVRRINELRRKAMPRNPKASDHYKPSSEMEEYMALFGLIAGGAIGGGAYFLL